jgi:hypothetical protein
VDSNGDENMIGWRTLMFGLVLTGMAGAAHAQEFCELGDFDCIERQTPEGRTMEQRLSAIEARLSVLEQGRGTPPSASTLVAPAAVNMAVDSSCGRNGCLDEAQYFCGQAGFSRGVPARTEIRYGSTFVVEITCVGG